MGLEVCGEVARQGHEVVGLAYIEVDWRTGKEGYWETGNEDVGADDGVVHPGAGSGVLPSGLAGEDGTYPNVLVPD